LTAGIAIQGDYWSQESFDIWRW